MRRHIHEEAFSASPEAVFALLHTPTAIQAWWGAQTVVVLAEQGGYWSASWGETEDDPEYITCARLAAFDPPHRMVMDDQRYFARTGPLPFEADFVTTFEVEPAPGGSVLRVIQDGFPESPDGDEFYVACEQGWCDTFAGIRQYLDTSREA